MAYRHGGDSPRPPPFPLGSRYEAWVPKVTAKMWGERGLVVDISTALGGEREHAPREQVSGPAGWP